MRDISSYFLLLSAILVGVSLATQAGINAQLREALASPVQAAFISFLIGTIILGFMLALQKDHWPSLYDARNIPWWAWLGGLLGAFNVAMSIYLAPKLGAVALAISVVCGQVIASVIYDHYGVVGYPKIEISLNKIAGAALLVLGVVLVSRK